MSTPSFVLYWLKDGGSGRFPAPPLLQVADYKPVPNIVNLFAASLALQGNAVVVQVPPEIQAVINDGSVRKLQSAGAKVVLSVFNGSGGLGWSTLGEAQNQQLVQSIRSILSATGLDGIDIDDENVGGSPGNFKATVYAIRTAMPNIIISNPVYNEADYQKYATFRELEHLMTYCSTMSYGDDAEDIIAVVNQFAGVINPYKLCAGVQAGPAGTPCDDNFTSILTSQKVAQWAKTKCMGVMLFSFSQDIVAFTGCPQHGPYPSPGDHAWQIAIQRVLYG
jgi:hypothetical protein